MTSLAARLLTGLACSITRGFVITGFAQFAQAPPPDLFLTEAMIERHAARGLEQLSAFLSQHGADDGR
jgi:hypothetical protein